MAAFLAADFTLVGVLLAAGSYVGGAMPLAGTVEVAGFGRIKTGIAGSLCVSTVETFWSHCEHP